TCVHHEGRAADGRRCHCSRVAKRQGVWVMDDPIVAVEGLWKTFGDVTAVEDLSFAVTAGQVYGLLGPNGAGKTTTLRGLLGFARLLLGRPELLVLDEPTNGLDPGEIREIRDLIGRLSTHGATVLLSSHHLSEVEQVCSHVIVMNHGRLIADGTVSELIGSSG